jgi:HAD superfamily hydrolase (TIGR01509 family)
LPARFTPMRLPDLEAVTVDGFGTLVELESPVTRLAGELEARGVHRSLPEVAEAFAAEASYYRRHAHRARDEKTLLQLREKCMVLFLHVLAASLEPHDFVEPFMESLVFRPVDGAVEALTVLREHGLKLAVVSNWDCTLAECLVGLGLLDMFDAVVSSAEAGAPKPAPRPFWLALERIGATPERALHVGDEQADQQGAEAAGMGFAPAPLATAVQRLM